MTDDRTADEAQSDANEDVCPHCGAVLDLARAIESERSVLRPRTRAPAREPDAVPPEDPGVA